MKFFMTTLVCLAITLTNTSAEYVTIAYDNASGYTNGWYDGSSEGYGFGAWTMKAGGAQGGFSGTYIANTNNNNDLDHIWSLPDGMAWGIYANGGSEGERKVAFRGFGINSIWTNKLDKLGDIFKISMENNDIDSTRPAKTGFTLRHLNATNSTHNYNANARFEFGFIGGETNYYIMDNSGKIDTGVGWRKTGFHLELELTTNINNYSFTIIDAIDDTTITNLTGILSGSGSIDSIALFLLDSIIVEPAGRTDIYFNNMEIQEYVEPTLFIIK